MINVNKEKKVYTITFHRANNYGATLQALALQKFLEKNNYETRLIDYDNYKISDHYRILKKDRSNLLKFLIHIVPRLFKINFEIKKEKNFDKFRKQLHMTNYYSDYSELNIDFPKCDVVICGSDQVWNPSITNGLDSAYFLQFNDRNIKKISYAASCGNSQNIDDVNLFSSYLKNIDKISVRETELKNFIIANKINKDVSVVLDPTLLLDKASWEEIIKKERVVKNKYIFTYCVNNGTYLYYDTINYLAKKEGLDVIYFDKTCSKIKVNKKSYYYVGPLDFLNLLYFSEFVITTSFHGFALSTLLNKKVFGVLSTYPDRLTTLANKLNIEDFFIKDKKDIDLLLDRKINWDEINQKLDYERNISSEWLVDAIESQKR